MRPLINVAVASVAVAFASGCATPRTFVIDAVRNEPEVIERQSYRIVSASPEMDMQDIRFLEAARYVGTALSSKGMYESPPGVASEIVVEVDFGIEGPIETVELITRTTPDRPVTQSSIAHPRRPFEEDPDDRREKPLYKEEAVPTVVAVYDKFVRITAREESRPNEGEEGQKRVIWSILISNRDQGSDLREYLPLLVAAGMDAIGTQTSENEIVVLSPSDKRVAFVTGSH